MTIGVLALQGSFNEHLKALRKLGVKGVEVRKAEQLEGIGALIIPGGESTAMAKLAEYLNLLPALRKFVKSGKPVWGTCAGLIFLADRADGQKEGGQELVGGIDCKVHRNYFGSQLDSFEVEIPIPVLVAQEGGPETFRGVFIRAPAVVEVGPEVQVLAECRVMPSPNQTNQETVSEKFQPQFPPPPDGKVVVIALRQGNIIGTAFHPELTADTRWHSFFLKMLGESSDSNAVAEDSEDNKPKNPDLPVFQ
ncbi:hypothetical protein Scep_014800 [Stephania cephalantha]|uniref:glutaminase n=1 Tax=Stephania cephalantha TaxID=152367 RepID=A0AAP0J1Y3_9MAGN